MHFLKRFLQIKKKAVIMKDILVQAALRVVREFKVEKAKEIPKLVLSQAPKVPEVTPVTVEELKKHFE